MMKKTLVIGLLLCASIKPSFAQKEINFTCEIDYTQGIVTEQARYINKSYYETSYDFNELGVSVASDNHHTYPERFFILNEPLVREYSLRVVGRALLFKSNNKVLISEGRLGEVDSEVVVDANIKEYSPSYLLAEIDLYNPQTMKNILKFRVNFDDRKIANKFVGRSLSFNNYDYYFECQDEITGMTFESYKDYWVSIIEAISGNRAEYTNGQ